MGDRMDKLDNRMDKLDQRFDRFEKQVQKDLTAIRFTLTELAYRDEVRQLENRLTRIEKHLGLTPLRK